MVIMLLFTSPLEEQSNNHQVANISYMLLSELIMHHNNIHSTMLLVLMHYFMVKY